MVITGATSNVDYLDVTSANHREYCARHGYGYRVFGDGDFARDRALCWSKIKFAREALRESRWVFWIDADAIFNRLDMKLEGFCWPQFLIICGLWDDAGFARPSFGTILLQQGPDTERMLAETWATPGKRYGDGHEEDGIKEVLAKWPELQSQVLCVHHRELNSCPPAKNWDADDFVLHFLQVRGTRRAVLADACAMARAGMWDGRPARNPGNGPPGAASEIGDRLGLGRRQADGQDAHATFRSGVAAVDAFLEHGYGQVRGMSSHFAAAVVARILQIQSEAGIQGGFVEIGTFMGRFFIAMAKALEGDEIAVGIDHFTWPSKDVFARFEANCAYYGLPESGRVTLARDSLSLQPPEILQAANGPVRLVHIDGEHTPVHLENDLSLGLAVLADRGVLVLDDMLHPAYPMLGLTVHRFLEQHPELRVLAVIDREDVAAAAKFEIGRREDGEFYDAALRKSFPQYAWEMPAQFGDYTALVLTPQPRLPMIS